MASLLWTRDVHRNGSGTPMRDLVRDSGELAVRSLLRIVRFAHSGLARIPQQLERMS